MITYLPTGRVIWSVWSRKKNKPERIGRATPLKVKSGANKWISKQSMRKEERERRGGGGKKVITTTRINNNNKSSSRRKRKTVWEKQDCKVFYRNVSLQATLALPHLLLLLPFYTVSTTLTTI